VHNSSIVVTHSIATSQTTMAMNCELISGCQQSMRHILAQQQLASQWHAIQLAQQLCTIQAMRVSWATQPVPSRWTAPPGLELYPDLESLLAKVLREPHSAVLANAALAPPCLEHRESAPLQSDASSGAGAANVVDARTAEWRIAHYRLKACQHLDKAIVSQSVCLGDLSDIRLMLYSKLRDEAGKKAKAQRVKPSKTAGVGPSDIELRLKAPHASGKMKFFVSVGSSREGPFECDFTESAIQSLGYFKVNRSALDAVESDALVICLELAGI